MSDYKQHIGKIKPVYIQPKESFYLYTKRVFKESFKEEVYNKYKEHECWQELTDDCNLYNKIFLIKDIWYVITESKEINGYDDIQELILNSDGSYTYVMRFYNGGTCLSEMIEEALENLEQ